MASKPRRAALASLAVAWGLCLAPMSVPDAAAEPPPAKDWEVEIEPHGRVDTPRGWEAFTIDAHDVIHSFDLAAMGTVKLRWERWVALFDVAWAKLSECVPGDCSSAPCGAPGPTSGPTPATWR